MLFADQVKNDLLNLIQEMSAQGNFSKEPGKHFSRKRKLDFSTMIVFCKTFLHKIAKTFCRSLQLHFVGNCKPGWQSWYLPAI